MSRVCHDLETLQALVDLFREELPRQLASIESALSVRDRDLLKTAAHTCKGAAANLGGIQAAAIAHAIEELAGEEAFEEAAAQTISLSASLHQLLQELETVGAA